MDLVTETDQAVEEMVKKTISEKYPEHKYLPYLVRRVNIGLLERKRIRLDRRVSWMMSRHGLLIPLMVQISLLHGIDG